MKYSEYNDARQKRINDFPMYFAFNNDQFNTKLNELGCTKDDIVGIGQGGFILKSDVEAYKQLLVSLDEEDEEVKKDDEFLKDMFMYELGNHEWQLTHDDEDTLNACGYELSDMETDDRARRIFVNAKSEYWNLCVENNWF